MEIKMIKVEDLKPYENNPRYNDDAVEYVANSIKEFGFKVPIVLDKNNVIVAGHTRYKASLELGLKEVPCIVADDLTDEQIKAYRLADNKVADKAEWNFELLDEELNGILDIDMSQFDFNIDALEELDLDELDDDREKTKVNISIVIDNYVDFEKIKERIENLADEINASLSIKMV